MTFARAKAKRAWLVRVILLAAAFAFAAGPASARNAEVTPPPSPAPAQAPAPDPAPTPPPAPAPKPVPKKKAPVAKSKPAPVQSSTTPSSPPPASPPPAPVSQPVPSAPKQVQAKATAKQKARPKPKATPKLPAHTVRTRPALGQGSAGAPRAALAGSSPVLSNVGDPSRPWWTPLAILFFSVPLLLILAALVPVGVVPYRNAVAWQKRRTDLALVGGSLLLLVGAIYLLV